MRKKINLKNQEVEYNIKRSWRARNLRVTIGCDAKVMVVAPYFFHESKIEKFLHEKAKWVIGKINYFKKLGLQTWQYGERGGYKKYKNQARNFIRQKLEEINKIYNFNYNKICIRNQRSRWGSCSKKRNLNFNYRLIFLPQKLSEYVIVHELCHLAEFNHSKNFWLQVARFAPDYKDRIKVLRKIVMN